MKTAFVVDGFDVHASLHDDDNPDLSYLGEYKDEPTTDMPYWDRALERVVDPTKPESCAACKGTGQRCMWDEQKGDHERNDMCDINDCAACGGTGECALTEDEQSRIAYLRHNRQCRYIVGGCGDPEGLAQDVKRLEDYGRGEWRSVGVVVTVSRAGVELARASVWGIESDSGDATFDEMIDDCVSEALPEAKAKLAELVKGAR